MKRRLLSTILSLLLFSAVSIYVITLAQGNRIDNEGVTNTSILRINSFPTNVTVFINDVEVSKNENRVEWLTPGITKVTLKKDGYLNWERIINLRSGVVEDIVAQLFPVRVLFEKLTTSRVDKILVPDNSEYIYYVIKASTNSDENGIWRLGLNRGFLNFSNNTPTQIIKLDSEFIKKLTNYSISVSSNNNNLLIDLKDSKELYYLNISNSTLSKLNESLGFYPDKFSWFNNSEGLVLTSDNLLSYYELSSKSLSVIEYNSKKLTPIFSNNNQVLYYFRKDLNKIFEYSNRQSAEVLDLNDLIKEEDSVLNMFVSSEENEILILKTNSTYIFLDLDKSFTRVFDFNYDLVDISSDSTKLIFKKDTNQYLNVLMEETVGDSKSYTDVLNEFNLNFEVENIRYTPNGNSIMVLSDNGDATKSLWISDYDGLNLNEVIPSEYIIDLNTYITLDGKYSYILLDDRTSDTESSGVYNIYKYMLGSE